MTAPTTEIGHLPTTPAPAGFWSRAVKHRGLMAGLLILGIAVAMALLAPVLAGHDPYQQNLLKRLTPPIWGGAPGPTRSAPTILAATTSPG